MPDRQILSRAELKDAVREAVHEELEILGLNASDHEARAEARADFSFLRKSREAMDGVAKKVGYSIITAILAIIGTVLWVGMQAKGMK